MTIANDTIALKLGAVPLRRPGRGLARRAGAAALASLLAALPGASAWAQTGRHSAEPEANPQFQAEMQGSPSGGAPLGAPLSADPAAAPTASPPLSADPLAAPAPVSSVQIGAAPVAQPRAIERVNPLDTRITVRVKGAPLATFLDTISAQSKVNFIMTEGIEAKKVTAFLQNVTVREALQVLLEIGGLTYQQIGKSNTYVVTLRSKAIENLITRIYTLAYIPLIPLSTAGSASAAAPSGGAGGAAGGGQTSEIGIINVLRSILTKSGQVALEPRTNSLIVTDIPEVFPQVEQIIAELDKKAPQVMIEAQIVEINSSRQKELGIEWGGAAGELVSFTAGQRDTSFPMQLPANLSRIRFLDPVSNIVSSVGGGAGALAANTAGGGELGGGTVQPAAAAFFNSGLKTSILDMTMLRVALRALVARSEARFLGKPKILTLNNKSAVIQVSQNQAVSVQQSVASGGNIAQASTSAERVQTGLVLSVTPQVNKEGYITMLIEPSFTDVQASAVSSASNKIFDPISRKATTLVRVKNGQTLVMGGLLSSTETKVVRKVPFFGYIPLIGWLFTSNSTQRRNSDLVLFITPTIVSD